MKKRRMLIAATVVCLSVAVWLFPQAAPPSRPLADLVPAGALLYLEAKDLVGLLRDWNGSAEKKAWTAGDNYQVFSRSRLFTRLADAQQEFGAAAGLAPDGALLDAVAGANSALAIYDIGNLEFLYITKMANARATTTALWQARANFQPRNSAGIAYYVRQDRRRMAAFAVTNDYLIIATQEQAIASALALIAGEARPKMNQERWFDQAVRAAQQPGEIRMVINFERVQRTPHFRSYWVQRNGGDLAQYSSIIDDVDRSSSEIRERRVLLRSEPAADQRPAEAAVAQLARLAPPDAGLYRARAAPDRNEIVSLIREKLIVPRGEVVRDRKTAPSVDLSDSVTGSEDDLESRIDEAPLVIAEGSPEAVLAELIGGANASALLEVQTTRVLPNGVFADTPAAIAILGSKPWDANAVRAALQNAVGSVWTISDIGAGWTQRRSGNVEYSALAGLGRLAVAVDGTVLILSNSEEMLVAMLGRRGTQPPAGATYAARYAHARELPNFERMMRLMDHPSLSSAQGDGREPLFFSENMVSLGRTLSRVQSMSIEAHDNGAAMTQSVTYRMQ